MARVVDASSQAPSEEDRQRWIDSRQRAGLPIPERKPAMPRSGKPLWGALGAVLCVPQEIRLPKSGFLVQVDEPTVRDTKRFVASLIRQGSTLDMNQLRQLLEELGPSAQDLLLACCRVSREGSWVRPDSEWFDSLPTFDALELVDTWMGAFNWETLKSRWESVSGKLGGVAGKSRVVA
jgi:hypothetical protein